MPRPNKSGLTPALFNEYRNRVNPATGKKFTQTDIAGVFGVTKQHVSWVKSEYEQLIQKTAREAVRKEAWPWHRMSDAYHQTDVCRRLGDHLEFIATGGKGMSEPKKIALRRFYKFLRETSSVVEFHPDIAPSRHSSVGGFAYRDRVEADDDLIIRLNELTESLTEDALDYWTFPREDP